MTLLLLCQPPYYTQPIIYETSIYINKKKKIESHEKWQPHTYTFKKFLLACLSILDI